MQWCLSSHFLVATCKSLWSLVSPQFPQPMGAPCIAIVKWAGWSSTNTGGRTSILDPSIPHLPRATGDFKGICFFSSLVASGFYFSFILNFPWSSHSVTIHFISLLPPCLWAPTQNMNPSGFAVLFLQGTIGGSLFCLQIFFFLLITLVLEQVKPSL